MPKEAVSNSAVVVDWLAMTVSDDWNEKRWHFSLLSYFAPTLRCFYEEQDASFFEFGLRFRMVFLHWVESTWFRVASV
jgi:hypothetical protein